jgi:putative ABC transport system ATP-binding protein
LGGQKLSVKVVEVEKIYRLGENKVHALRGINMELEKGEFVAFMGPSGSGKTTLLNLIGVLDKPSKGKIYIDGIDLTTLKEKDLTKLRRNTMGFIFQFYNLIPVLSAFENVELPMLIAGVPTKARETRARELLEMVGLGNRLYHRPDELSGGEQQRVAIVRALANRPSIVLADEPTGDLDSKTGKEVVQALRDLSSHEGATVIVVTHDPTIASMASRVFEMRDGMLIKEHSNEKTLSPTQESLTENEGVRQVQGDQTLTTTERKRPLFENLHQNRRSIVALIAAVFLILYAIGIVTNFFGSPMFSMFFILSNETAHGVAYGAAAVGAILSITILILNLQKRRKVFPETSKRPIASTSSEQSITHNSPIDKQEIMNKTTVEETKKEDKPIQKSRKKAAA